MPEYLAPGLYVEEVDTGSKPIEGVSTSTAGMVGVTERGPVGVPILVTSSGEFERWFGGKLDRDLFNATAGCCYLPDAVEGYFSNGGKRLWVTRIAPTSATPGRVTLFGRDTGDVTTRVAVAAEPQATTVEVLGDGADIAEGSTVRIGGGSDAQYLEVDDVAAPGTLASQQVDLDSDLGTELPAGTAISLLAPAAATTIGTNAAAASTSVRLAQRAGLQPGSVLVIDTGGDGTVVVVTSDHRSQDGPGDVDLASALAVGVGAGVGVTPYLPMGRVRLIDDAAGDATALAVDGTAVGTEAVSFRRTDGSWSGALVTVADLPTTVVTLAEATPVERTVLVGAPVIDAVERVALVALDPGSWGNRLRAIVLDEESGLVNRAEITDVTATSITLRSVAGVEPGTMLRLDDPVAGPAVAVVAVDRTTRVVSFDGARPAGFVVGARVNSVEFRLDIHLLRQPDLLNPSRDTTVIARESFQHLSMQRSHSRYVGKIVGSVGGPPRLSDRRPQGDSWYVRVADGRDDDAPGALGPDALVDVLPNGSTRPAGRALAGGSDAIGQVDDNLYIGEDAVDPEDRTGIWSLAGVDSISLIAAPGRTTAPVHAALIGQCEELRYRFAVLDSPPPQRPALADVQQQRQQFDTKYAALYYPWLLIPEVFPKVGSTIDAEPIPPSGHLLGVYARTDVERGVHKAPANEVVRSITGLHRTISKREQDLLNPFPSNINVIRDFRRDNRGLRVWGARVITSDPDWKYVPVRRLAIFVEKSLDVGLQWVVFEPNAERLWARVVRSISAFLTTVWRNGALEGATVEEAFFVKCDRTTMTQAEIDNGQLVVQVGLAAVKPAEFVIVRIGLWTAHADD